MGFSASMSFSPASPSQDREPIQLLVTVTSGALDAPFVVGPNSELVYTNPNDGDAIMPGQAVIEDFAKSLEGQTVAGGGATTVLSANAVFFNGQPDDIEIGVGGTLDDGAAMPIALANLTVETLTKGS
jgi:hypothetical protein